MEIRLNRSDFLAELAPDAGHRRAADDDSGALSPSAASQATTAWPRRHRPRRLAHLLVSRPRSSRTARIAVRPRSSSRSFARCRARRCSWCTTSRALTITRRHVALQDPRPAGGDFPTLPDVSKEKAVEIPFAELRDDGGQGPVRGLERGVALPAQRRAAQARRRKVSRWWPPTATAWRSSRDEIEGISEGEEASWCRARRCRSCSASRATAASAFRRGEHHLSFRLGKRELICRILEGTFPDYERVIAKDNDKKAIFERQALAEAVRRVALLTGDRARAVRLQFAPTACSSISAANPDLGEAVEEVPCDYDRRRAQAGDQPRLPRPVPRRGRDREGAPRAQGREHASASATRSRASDTALPLRDHAHAHLTRGHQPSPCSVSLTTTDFRNLAPARLGRRRPGRTCSSAATAPARPACSRRSTSLATTRSFRTAQLADCARHGSRRVLAQRRGRGRPSHRGSRSAGLATACARAAQRPPGLARRAPGGTAACVAWTAADVELLTGAALARRRFLDRGVVSTQPASARSAGALSPRAGAEKAAAPAPRERRRAVERAARRRTAQNWCAGVRAHARELEGALRERRGAGRSALRRRRSELPALAPRGHRRSAPRCLPACKRHSPSERATAATSARAAPRRARGALGRPRSTTRRVGRRTQSAGPCSCSRPRGGARRRADASRLPPRRRRRRARPYRPSVDSGAPSASARQLFADLEPAGGLREPGDRRPLAARRTGCCSPPDALEKRKPKPFFYSDLEAC